MSRRRLTSCSSNEYIRVVCVRQYPAPMALAINLNAKRRGGVGSLVGADQETVRSFAGVTQYRGLTSS